MLPDAKSLIDVRAVGLERADALAQLVGRVGGARLNLAERTEHARTAHRAGVDRIAPRLVAGGAERLHGRESGVQHRVEVRLHRLVDLLRRFARLAGPLAVETVRLEVPVDVHVHVDHAGHQRDVAEVVRHGAAALIDRDNLRAAHFDDRVGARSTAAVEQAGRANGDRIGMSPAFVLPDEPRRQRRLRPRSDNAETDGCAHGGSIDPPACDRIAEPMTAGPATSSTSTDSPRRRPRPRRSDSRANWRRAASAFSCPDLNEPAFETLTVTRMLDQTRGGDRPAPTRRWRWSDRASVRLSRCTPRTAIAPARSIDSFCSRRRSTSAATGCGSSASTASTSGARRGRLRVFHYAINEPRDVGFAPLRGRRALRRVQRHTRASRRWSSRAGSDASVDPAMVEQWAADAPGRGRCGCSTTTIN